jgi:hypothetical protein
MLPESTFMLPISARQEAEILFSIDDITVPKQITRPGTPKPHPLAAGHLDHYHYTSASGNRRAKFCGECGRRHQGNEVRCAGCGITRGVLCESPACSA